MRNYASRLSLGLVLLVLSTAVFGQVPTGGVRGSVLAGKATPRGGVAPTVTLPSNYRFGDLFQTQGLRLSKDFKLHEKLNLELIGKVFNLFKISNLTGFGQTLDGHFGQSSGKTGQAFSIGGPRAMQFAARLKF
ncbi:MAG: hypothetical protein ACKVZH_20690 [Blastocatellia bacterium]